MMVERMQKLNILEKKQRDERIAARYAELVESGEKCPFAVLEAEFSTLTRSGIFAIVQRIRKETTKNGRTNC